MKLDQLPVEMLIKIFSYLPTYSEVSLVNKTFYSIACKVSDSHICLRINQRFIERFLCNEEKKSQLMHSIQTSNRQITKLEIDDSKNFDLESLFVVHQDLIVSVFRKFSATLKFVALIGYPTVEPNFMEILSLIPNVELLHISGIHFSAENRPPKRCRRCNSELNLKNLKVLTIFGGNEFAEIFRHLPVGVLKELDVMCHWNSLPALLNRQCNIKKLCLRVFAENDDDTEVTADILDKLRLQSLELQVSSITNSTIAEILSKQTELKSLIFDHVSDETITDGLVMDVVADLSELEILAIDVSKTPVTSFVKIRKLKKLQELQLKCFGDRTEAMLKALIKSDNSSLKKFSWLSEENNESRLSWNVIGPLAKSAPHLTHFCYSPAGVSEIMERNGFLLNFNFVEVLEIGIWGWPLTEADKFFNPNLRELTITVADVDEFYESWLDPLVAAYPNLRKLKLTVTNTADPFEIKLILDGFTTLESLIVRNGNCRDAANLNCLLNYNLKFVSLECIDEATLSDELMRNMRTRFGVVNFDDGGLDGGSILNLAVDRYTMNCEREITYPYHLPI